MVGECRDELVRESLELIRNALMKYLKVSCRRSLNIVRLTGQKRVVIDFYGLFNCYESTEDFPRFVDAYNYALGCVGLNTISQLLEGTITEGGESGYQLILDVEKFEGLCREVLKS
jgi:hypothetical protein